MPETAHLCLYVMLEERSAERLMKALLPHILPEELASGAISAKCIPHRGRGDLQKSIPNKLRNWRTPNSLFVILHDQDNEDCHGLKRDLRSLCAGSQCEHNPLIRIVCTELESWYFGDLDAVEAAYPGFKADRYRNKSQYRVPDAIQKPSERLKSLIKEFDKSTAAKKIPRHMDINRNRSASFICMVEGIRNLVRGAIVA